MDKFDFRLCPDIISAGKKYKVDIKNKIIPVVSFFEKIRKKKNVIILMGEASIGKTTSMQRLYYHCLEKKDNYLPIYYHLKRLNSYNESLEIIKKQTSKGNTYLLLDAFDEIYNEDKKQEVRDLIESWEDENGILIITSRYNPLDKKSNKENKKIAIAEIQKIKKETIKKVLDEENIKCEENLLNLFSNTMFLSLFLKLNTYNDSEKLSKVKDEASFLDYYFERYFYQKNNEIISESLSWEKEVFSVGEYVYSNLLGNKLDISQVHIPHVFESIFETKEEEEGVIIDSPQVKYLNYALAKYCFEKIKTNKKLFFVDDFNVYNEFIFIETEKREAFYYLGQMLKNYEFGRTVIYELNNIPKGANVAFLFSIFIYSGYNNGCLDDGIFNLGRNFSKLAGKLYLFRHNSWIKEINTKYFKTTKYIDGYDSNSSILIKLVVNTRKIRRFSFENLDCLEKLHVGPHVRKIEPYAFWNSNKLSTIEVSNLNKRLYSGENNCVIDIKQKKLVLGCKNTKIPDDKSVLYIGEACFSGDNLGETVIVVPSSIKKINMKSKDMQYTRLNEFDINYGLDCYIRYYSNGTVVISSYWGDDVKKNVPDGGIDESIDDNNINEFVGKNVFKKIIFKMYEFLNSPYWDYNEATYLCRRSSCVDMVTTICIAGITSGAAASITYGLISGIVFSSLVFIVGVWVCLGAITTFAVRCLFKMLIRGFDILYVRQMLNCQKWMMDKKQKSTYFDIDL